MDDLLIASGNAKYITLLMVQRYVNIDFLKARAKYQQHT